MVSWEDAKAVFVAVDEHETGWMAQADVGGALERCGLFSKQQQVKQLTTDVAVR